MQNAKDDFYVESTIDMYNEGYLEDADKRVMDRFGLFLVAGFTHQQIADMLTPAHVMQHYDQLSQIDPVALAERMSPAELYENFKLLIRCNKVTPKIEEIASQWTYRQVVQKIGIMRELGFSHEYFDLALFRLDEQGWRDLINLADYDDDLMFELLDLASQDWRSAESFIFGLTTFYSGPEIVPYLVRLADMNVSKKAISETLLGCIKWYDVFYALHDAGFPISHKQIIKAIEDDWEFFNDADALIIMLQEDNRFVMEITPQFIRSFNRIYDWRMCLYEGLIEQMIDQYRIHFLESVMLAHGKPEYGESDAIEFARALDLLEAIIGPDKIKLDGYDIPSLYTSITDDERVAFAEVTDVLAKYALM